MEWDGKIDPHVSLAHLIKFWGFCCNASWGFCRAMRAAANPQDTPSGPAPAPSVRAIQSVPGAQAMRAADLYVSRWYVVQVQPHAENRAGFHLERQGYRLFCPRIHRTIRHARKVTRTLVPLFPGYLFLNLDIAHEQWRAVNGTTGVARLIAHGDTPQPVPIGVVEALRAQLDEDGAVARHTAFEIGQAVRIVDGPFADLVGKLEKLDAPGRVRVLLDLLGRSVSVTLRTEVLVSAA
ncbi:MAG: transcriptional activator RfaH [Rhizomicrobium sp.]